MLKNWNARHLLCVLVLFVVSAGFPQNGFAAVSCSSPLSQGLPKRLGQAPSGSEVMQSLRQTRGSQRDQEVVHQIMSGNIPAFLRKLVPVDIKGTTSNGEPVLVTICVTPEYLAVGNNQDFVRVPMGLAGAARVAGSMGFMLPTTKMVDAIYRQAAVHLAPRPMKPTPQMESTDYLLRHNLTLQDQKKEARSHLADLTAGQKKDIVLTNRLRSHPGRVAIYGWHRLNGRPIQPLSTVHGAEYADYSHGVRLVSETAFVNGKPMALTDIMASRDLSGVVSNEGPITNARALLASLY
jgi:hypothetical protein